MALIVEDGTGLSNSESYISLAAFQTYCDGRGYNYDAYDDEVIEQRLRMATAYIDTIFRYKGARSKSTQALEFPRSDLFDWSALLVTGIPNRVKHACAELAFTALTENLYQTLERGGRVTSESVGPVSVSYADDAPAGKVYQLASNLLQPYVHKKRDNYLGPSHAALPEAGYFGFGMHDNPGTTTDTLQSE